MAAVRRWVAKTILPLLVSALATAASGSPDVDSVRLCVEENAPRISSVQVLTLTVRELGEERPASRMKLTWRRLADGESRILLRFETPEDLAGAAVLVESNGGPRPVVHLQLPDLDRPQRVTNRSQFEGFLGEADLGLEELRQLLDPLSGKQLHLVEAAAEHSGRKVWVMEEYAAEPDARYPRIVTFVDQEYCLPLRAEFYDQEGVIAKLLRVDPARITREAESWMPLELVFTDPQSGNESVLRVDELEVDVPIAPGLLTRRALSQPAPRPTLAPLPDVAAP